MNLFDAAGNISGSVDFVHGAFQAASVAWDAGDGPGIDLGGPLNIYLTHLGGSISLNPTTINATGTITGGPQYEGCALFGITGSMTAQFGPFSFDANANGQLLCQNVSNEYFHIDDSGSVLIGAQINISLLFLQFSRRAGGGRRHPPGSHPGRREHECLRQHPRNPLPRGGGRRIGSRHRALR